MWQCHSCRAPLSLEVQKKNRLCPTCHTDIHCCKNCVHYDENLTSKCTQPDIPWVRDREHQNSCDFFEFANTRTNPGNPTDSAERNNEAEKAKAAFRALFRTP